MICGRTEGKERRKEESRDGWGGDIDGKYRVQTQLCGRVRVGQTRQGGERDEGGGESNLKRAGRKDKTGKDREGGKKRIAIQRHKAQGTRHKGNMAH